MNKKGLFKGIKKHIVGLILLSGILSYLSLQVAVYISYAIDGILFGQLDKIPSYLISVLEIDKIKSLMILSGMILVVNLMIALGTYIRQRITTGFTLKISANLKKMLYTHILHLEYESYQSYSKVEMLQRANEDAQDYANFYKNQFNLILDIISLSFFIVAQGISLSTVVTIYLIVAIVIMLLFALWYYYNITKVLENVILKKRKMLGAIINNINQFKFVRICNRQKEEIQEYKRLNQDYTQEDIKFIKLILFYDIVSEHITYLSDPIICLLGGIDIMKGKMSMGGLTALLLLASKILKTLYSFGENLEIVNTFLVVRQKIKKLMDLKEEKMGNYFYNLEGDVVFHKVSIKISEKELLTNLNFTIKKGEKIAILGDNGSGKSILAKAILGFYPVEGNIYLNYHNSKQLDKSNIRQYIDLVSGEADLFSGTILDNIQLDIQITKEQLWNVTKQAEIQEDINKFEKGYQTVVGEKGVKLSGGQKQRILIARALIRNKSIMIFDSIFSQLDQKTSHKIFENLTKNYPETTMIFITHKLEIKDYVDRIIKLEEGTSERATREVK